METDTVFVVKSNDHLGTFYVTPDQLAAHRLAGQWGAPATAERMTLAELDSFVYEQTASR